MLWPGVAEELTRRRRRTIVRDGYFKDVDILPVQRMSAAISHVAMDQQTAAGSISVEYTFNGEAAHAAGAPWRGTKRARCGRVDEYRLEFPARASAARSNGRTT